MAKLGKQKKAYDDSIRDLDDVYFEVQEREEQRRKQGLPSLIGVLRGHQSPVSAREDADDDTVPSRFSKDSYPERRAESRARNMHGKQTTRNRRPRRRAERAL
jgi:hypothetical protein